MVGAICWTAVASWCLVYAEKRLLGAYQHGRLLAYLAGNGIWSGFGHGDNLSTACQWLVAAGLLHRSNQLWNIPMAFAGVAHFVETARLAWRTVASDNAGGRSVAGFAVLALDGEALGHKACQRVMVEGWDFYVVCMQCSKFNRVGLAMIAGHDSHGMDQTRQATSLTDLGIQCSVSNRVFDGGDHDLVSGYAAD